jgi:hypothetical protein
MEPPMGSNPERPGKNLSKTAAARRDGNDMHQEQAAQLRASRGMRPSKTKCGLFARTFGNATLQGAMTLLGRRSLSPNF